MSICQVPLNYLKDRLDLKATEESGATFIANWWVENLDPTCGGSLGNSSLPAEVEHAPLFSHFWSRKHHESSHKEYTFDS